MKTYLRAYDLWEVVEIGKEPNPLLANPTLAQIKHHNKESIKKYKALFAMQSYVQNEIYTRAINCDSLKKARDILKEEI